jgi:exosome complex component RRP4
MGDMNVKDKTVVVPGEVLATGMDFVPAYGTYREGENVLAGRLGLVNFDNRLVKIIPLSGRYNPRKQDIIIGKVIDVTMNGWRVDTNSAYSALLMVKEATSEYIEKGADLTKYFDIGDWIACKIINVTSQKLIDLTMRGPGLRKLDGGRIIEVASTKVPRIIGRQGSMISMVKEGTGCRVTVGQNGIVWLQGTPEGEIKAVNMIKDIERRAHEQGLTESIKSELQSSGALPSVSVSNEQKESEGDQ